MNSPRNPFTCSSGCGLPIATGVILRTKGSLSFLHTFRRLIWYCSICQHHRNKWSGRLYHSLQHRWSWSLHIQHPLPSMTSSSHYRSIGLLSVKTRGKLRKGEFHTLEGKLCSTVHSANKTSPLSRVLTPSQWQYSSRPWVFLRNLRVVELRLYSQVTNWGKRVNSGFNCMSITKWDWKYFVNGLRTTFSSVQFSHSVMSDSLPPINHSTLGLPVHHQLPEST